MKSVEERRAYMRAYKEANRERLAAKAKAYHALPDVKERARVARAEKMAAEEYRRADAERQKRYREANKETLQAKAREWRAANREYKSERDKLYRANNLERVRHVKRKWVEQNREKTRAANRAWHRRNPQSARMGQQRRRMKYVGKLSRDLPRRLMTLQRGCCANCRRSIRGKFHLDHIVPVAKGGLHEDHNIQLLCPSCNHRKGAKDPIDWATSQGRLL